MPGHEFRSDLYRGTARFYDEFRVPYPTALQSDLCSRARTTGVGRLLDVACGTGQLAFGLRSSFAEVWAVDQEREAVEFARVKALREGIDSIRWIVGRAEDVVAESSFESVVIGSAFHRLQRAVVAAAALGWLAPRGHLALVWSDSPWNGSRPWQRAMTEGITHWTRKAGAAKRVPADLGPHLKEEPHASVLAGAGFTIVDEFTFATPYEWTVEKLTGFVYSTSFLSHAALGVHVQAFENDFRERLLAVEPDGVFREEIGSSYLLARRP